MAVPEEHEAYQFAELFIQLPRDWPVDSTSLQDLENGWPIVWLRNLARYPHLNEASLGPFTIITNADSYGGHLTPNSKFTAILLLAEHMVESEDWDHPVNLYRMMPLYSEEVELHRKSQMTGLLNAFDRHKVSFVVDMNRKNVAL